ncbi:MAG: autotransporter domain-containing protein, partial [Methylotenera sp.]
GTGAHEIINTGFITGITVDQSDTDPLLAAGARTFTLTNTSGSVSSINLNDVAGAVNTINYTYTSGGGTPTISANGLGTNIMNMDCQAACGLGSISGLSSLNIIGNSTNLGLLSVVGDVTLNTSGVALSGDVTAANLNTGTGTLTVGLNSYSNSNLISISGNLSAAGNINLGKTTLSVGGDTLWSGSQISTLIGKYDLNQVVYGKLDTLGTATFSNSVTIVPSVETNTQVFDGQKFVIATHVNALSPATVQQTDTSGWITWSVSETNGELILVADLSVPALIRPLLTTAAYNALDAAFSPVGNGLQGALQAELLALHGQDLVSAAERLRPETNDGALRLVLSNTDRVFGMLDNRLLNSYLAKAKNDAKDTSAITDNTLTNGKGIWVQGFGDRGSQEGFDQADGYSVSAAGIAMGADRELDVYNGNASLGLAFSYARGNITNSSNTTNNRIDTNSYLATVYGSRNWEDFYLNAAVGVGRNTYDTHRHLTTHTATGQHDSWQFSSRLAAGWPLMYNDNVTFVPMAGLDYSHIKESGYSENGKELLPVYDPITLSPILNSYAEQSSPINLAIESRSFDSIRSGLGGKAIYSWQQLDWGAELELHGLYRHEFGNLAQDSVARFAAGGKSFTSPGLNPVRDDFMLGGSLRLTGEDENDQITFLTSYDATIREKYFGQTMSLNLRYDFDQAPNYRKEAKAKLATVATKTNAEQKVNATEQDIAEIQKAMQAELVVSATNPVDAEKQKAIDSTLKTWATALSNKNLEAYFNSYAADFETPDGSTRQQWERKRKFELSNEDNPAIKISHLTIEPNGDQALAIFTQSVGADAKQISVRKIVDLANRNGRWLIVREDSMAKTQ